MCTYRQKNHFIILIVFEILKIKNPVFWLAKNIFGFANQTWKSTWEYNLRTKFLPDMCFQQNHKSHYVTWFRPKKSTHKWTIFFAKSKKPCFLVIHEKFMRSFKIQEKFQKSPMSHFRGKKVYLLTYWHTDSAEIIGTVFFYRWGSNNLATKTFFELLEFQESWNVIVQG